MLRRAKKLEDARGLLEAQPAPRTSGVQGVLAEVYEDLKQYDRALAVVQSLFDQGYDGVWSYRTQARIQIAMKAYEKALRTTAEGLEKHGGDEPLLELAATARKAR